jgi:hypothetical protein
MAEYLVVGGYWSCPRQFGGWYRTLEDALEALRDLQQHAWDWCLLRPAPVLPPQQLLLPLQGAGQRGGEDSLPPPAGDVCPRPGTPRLLFYPE